MKDSKVDFKINNYYSFYHLVGQKYSTKIIYTFIGFYHNGYIYLYFHYLILIMKLILKDIYIYL